MDTQTADLTSMLDEAEEPDNIDQEEEKSLSHQEAMAIFQRSLADIIQDDPLLCDLPRQATLEEVNSRIALE